MSEKYIEPGDDEACESVSICTVRSRHTCDEDEEVILEAPDNEILSAVKLVEVYKQEEKPISDGDNMIEIDLAKHNQLPDIKNDSGHANGSILPSNQDCESISKNNDKQQRACETGFAKAEVKMSFTNERIREYFESFRAHGSETVRLYQFFKSVRTELVACLLFTVITSHALIVCRTHLFESNTIAAERSRLQVHPNSIDDPTQSTRTSVNKQATAVHLVSGLVSSFAVASLTQVFGHVSGCHLIPSVSVALYVKGHISRARLTSYLAAQSAGSMLGVGLLGLLTTSQLTSDEFKELLHSSSKSTYLEIEAKESKLGEAVAFKRTNLAPIGAEVRSRRGRRRRRRRKRAVSADISSNLNETFLGRIGPRISQTPLAEPHKLDKRQRTNQTGNAAYEPPKTIIANVSTSQVGKPDGGPRNAATSRASVGRHLRLSRQPYKMVHLVGRSELATKVRGGGDMSSTLVFDIEGSPKLASRLPERLQQVAQSSSTASPHDKSRCDHDCASGIPTTLLTTKMDDRSGASRHQNNYNPPAGNKEKFFNFINLRRSRRQVARSPNEEVIKETKQQASSRYINLLAFALPDLIMSGESIRQCISKQVNAGETSSSSSTSSGSSRAKLQHKTSRLAVESDEIGQLASNSFVHCLSLSNGSQMFIFQLLATLFIVLSYLVNVDPRRTDLGFKSLSIGLSYFVANITTIRSGGFFGNPCHLVGLSWLSPTANWQPEWFIYLLTPFLGGLFGALSHEYIDFTSLRNRNKQLKLRRSFYSLDKIPQQQLQSRQLIGQSENHQPNGLNMMGLIRSHSSSSLRSLGEASSVLTFNNNLATELPTSAETAAGRP